MTMRLFRPWYLMQCLYPGAVFRIKTQLKVLYLTFDDGPDSFSTPVILGILEKYNIRAVFFCNGQKAREYPEVIEKIRKAGHTIGNHTFSHLNGWRSSLNAYLEDVFKSDEYTSAERFRPPYGHMTPRQFRALKKKYKIVFWDLMPYDFDKKFPAEKVLQILKLKIRPGSVIVLHDTAESKAVAVLKEFIEYAIKEGYMFKELSLESKYSHPFEGELGPP